MREWSTNTTPTSTPAPGLLSLAEPLSNGDNVVSLKPMVLIFLQTSQAYYPCKPHAINESTVVDT